MEMTAERQSTEQRSALPTEGIEWLFDRFLKAYGTEKTQAMWRGQDRTEVKLFWGQQLAKFSSDELRAGVNALFAAHPSWPPTLPEFATLCRPQVNHEAAFVEAIRGLEHRKRGEMGQWSNRAIYWAAQDVTPFDVLGSTWPQIRARWITALDRRLTDPNLPAIPEPPLQLTAPEGQPASNTENLAHLHAMIANAPKVGPRAWAGRLLERHAAGDKTVSDHALSNAQKCAQLKRPLTAMSEAEIEQRRTLLMHQAAGKDTFLDGPNRLAEV